MPKLIYKKAGNIELIRRSDSVRFLAAGVIESIEPSISRKSSTLPDGNSDWDMEFSTGMEGQVVVNLSAFQPKLYAGLAGAAYTEGSSYAIRHRCLDKGICKRHVSHHPPPHKDQYGKGERPYAGV